MKLSELFKNYQGVDVDIKDIKTNSKDITCGDLFVCTKGNNFDRHDFIDDAINNGAKAVIVSKDIEKDIPVIKIDNIDDELFNILNIFYDYPLKDLKIIGITGTDGKTTTAKIIQQLLGNDICGYIGTLGYDCAFFEGKTHNTTPPIEQLFKIFSEFRENKIKYVALEASSEAFFYHRLDNIKFELGLHTNITSEHLNTHKTLENYIECKKQLFINSKIQILNKDDLHFKELKLVSNNYSTYGQNECDLVYKDITLYPNKTSFSLNYQNINYKVVTSLLGKFNVYNLSLAILSLLKLGFNINDLLNKTNNLIIPGRMQIINEGQDFFCIVDYAHTANAVKNVLEFAKSLNVNRIITLIGQAGGRDIYKRKEVGKYVLEYSDLAILTEDDPRFEKVEDIIQMMLSDSNKSNYIIIPKRIDAIKEAMKIIKKDDLLLLLGKGTDNYMAIEDRRDKYSEIEEITKAIKNIYL